MTGPPGSVTGHVDADDGRRGTEPDSPRGTEVEVDPNTAVLGRASDDAGAVGRLGTHRAPDGSDGAPLSVDLERPHAALVVGKRGYGKSYTLGVLAEELARTRGVAPVVVDPMGAFDGLAAASDGDPVPATVVADPTVPASAVDPRGWCRMLGLSVESAVGSLVWRAADREDSLAGMRSLVDDADVPGATRRGAANHLSLAAEWDVFGEDRTTLDTPGVTVLDASGLDPAPTNALVYGVATRLYADRIAGRSDRLPWLLVDEAHVPFEGVAADALRTLLTRGRSPGVSLVVATQRPSALPDVAISQADLTIAHRLTARPDREALERARPSYLDRSVVDRTPARPGEATVVDDATETAREVRIRSRDTPHEGGSPRASEVGVE